MVYGKRIVIIGASVAALVMAQKLKSHPEIAEIVLLERVNFTDVEDHARAHRHHTHVLSAYGLQELYRLFPNLRSEMDDIGAPVLRWGTPDVEIGLKSGSLTQAQDIGVETRSITRVRLEALLRHEVLTSSKVTVINPVDATGFVRAGGKVQGVRFTLRRGAVLPEMVRSLNEHEYWIQADDVVIATGSGQQWLEWFKTAHLPVPPKKVVDAGLLYLTADFEGITMPSKMFGTGDKADRAMIIAKIEGENRYRVTIYVYGFTGKYPETHEEFVALARTCSDTGAMYLDTGWMVSHVHKFPNCESRMFEIWNVDDWPDHIYVLSDAVVRLNPRYGQGMTLAILEADWAVKNILRGSALRYAKGLKKVVSFSWSLATGADESYLRSINTPNMKPLPLSQKLAQRYFDVLLGLAGSNVNAARAFFQVSNYLAKPTALFSPGLIWAVLVELNARRVHPYLPTHETR